MLAARSEYSLSVCLVNHDEDAARLIQHREFADLFFTFLLFCLLFFRVPQIYGP
jgi:hypothetical protein